MSVRIIDFFQQGMQDTKQEGQATAIACLLGCINFTVTYVETFCCSGTPKTWATVLQALEERDGPNVYTYAALLKAMLEVENKGLKAIIRQYREFLLAHLVPHFITDYLQSYKGLYAQLRSNTRDQIASVWNQRLEPFAVIAREGKPFDYGQCQ